jgi:hypothetical protein
MTQRFTDPQREGRQVHRYRRRIVQLVAEVRRLREIEHAAWHLLDNSADDIDGAITIVRADLEALSKLLPEGHPEHDEAIKLTFRPLLVSGMLADTTDGPVILIDSEQPEAEQRVALWHELMHLVGLEDEDLVEDLARRLDAACPELLSALKALSA